MQILENISLKPYNSFGIQVAAKYFTGTDSLDDMREALNWSREKQVQNRVLGGGSNVLFTSNFDGLIIRNQLRGIEKLKEDDKHVYIRVAAGEVWHDFVMYCLENNYAGVENLALIPGCVGASPMQNIGAYGVEMKEVFHELTALHKTDLNLQTFSYSDCAFGYRESVFKNKYREAFVIMDVTFRLNKYPHYRVEYGAIRQELEKNNVRILSIREIANAVMAIRRAKLPDPAEIGNAGSFFKNPSVDKEKFNELKNEFPGLVAYENADGTMKLAAGWMIEACGYKGFRRGDAGVHSKQALVLVNYGNATGGEVLAVCEEVQNAVFSKFAVVLTPEVNII